MLTNPPYQTSHNLSFPIPIFFPEEFDLPRFISRFDSIAPPLTLIYAAQEGEKVFDPILARFYTGASALPCYLLEATHGAVEPFLLCNH